MHIHTLCVPSAVTLLRFILELIHFVPNMPFLVLCAVCKTTVLTTEMLGQSAFILGLNGFNVAIKLGSKSMNLTHSI